MNEIMFYGGMAASGVFLLFGVIFFAFYYIRGIKLRYIFDKEYGESFYTKKGNQKNED